MNGKQAKEENMGKEAAYGACCRCGSHYIGIARL